jgi:hypothetical protein
MIRVKSALQNFACSSGAECEAVQCKRISEVRSLCYYASSSRSLQAPISLGLSMPFKILPCSSGAECEAVQCQPISDVRSLCFYASSGRSLRAPI